MTLTGNAVSKGVAVGRVLRFVPYAPPVLPETIEDTQVEAAVEKFFCAKAAARQELENIRGRLNETDPDKAKIMAAHIEILKDIMLDEEIRGKIAGSLHSAEHAARLVFEKYAKMLSRSKDELFRERATDLRDVCARLLRCMDGAPEQGLALLREPAVVVAHDLFPSDTASMDRDKVLAIVTEIGGPTSHTAIIARGYGIPALVGVEGAMETLREGQLVAVDALAGRIVPDPTPAEEKEYAAKAEAHRKQVRETSAYLSKPGASKDGVPVEIHVNIGATTAKELEGAAYADGVGLLRSEFLYMERQTLPDEQEQAAAYAKVLKAFGSKPVVLRTLDIGGDKQLPALPLPAEQNPFLGKRALRLCLSLPDLFHIQLRAALRASVEGNLWLMFPMVGSLDDVRRAKAALEKARRELDAEGVPYAPDVKVGIMIEIPSIAMMAEEAAREVDFASIGTNDLCQYLLAVDRLNPGVSEYYETYHPGLWRMLRQIIQAFLKAGKPISVCGEMGGDPLAAPALVGLGLRKLSMQQGAMAQIKKTLGGLSLSEMETMAGHVLGLATAAEAEQYLTERISSL